MSDSSAKKNFDQYIAEQLEILRRNYRSTGDALTSRLAAEELCTTFEGAVEASGSIQLAKLHTFICDLRLSHATSLDDLEEVKRNAEKSIDLLYSSPAGSQDIVQSLASANLYLAVALKAQDKKDESFGTIARAKRELRRFFNTNYLDEILLGRQEVLMRQEESEFAKLLDMVPSYLDTAPHEAYASIKRVFEFALNRRLVSLAEDLLPVLKESFRNSAPKLGPVAKVSFEKNLGQYYFLIGKKGAANRVLSSALIHAAGLGLDGQKAQIKALLMSIKEGGDPVLGSFEI